MGYNSVIDTMGLSSFI